MKTQRKIIKAGKREPIRKLLHGVLADQRMFDDRHTFAEAYRSQQSSNANDQHSPIEYLDVTATLSHGRRDTNERNDESVR
jgi:hypothetical protein